MTSVADVQEALDLEACHFAELLGTLYALRFTGPVTLHFLNGEPQLARLGQPVEVRFPEHPANRDLARSLDTDRASPPSSPL